MTSTEGVALQVDDVYVPVGLVERKKPSKRQGNISPEQGSELYKETEITKTFEHDAFLEEVIKQKNTPKSQGKRIAIIGEPGAGKTTLLQQIADWVSREIYQSIVIWVSLADLRQKELKSYLFETWLTQVAEKTGKAEPTEQLKNDFVALFNQNNVWLLLDGLDEMSASSGNPLTEIARQFREVRLISQARIVLTCRVNLWDGSTNALDDFDTYCSLDFSYPKDVERFIHKWFAAIPETGKQLCTVLKESGKEPIQDLVKNPLRLTLLCLNWQSGDGKLPDTQAGLYQQFVDDFYKWKKEEIPTTPEQQQLNVKLGELAKAAIDKEATRFRLRHDFVSQFLGNADDEKSLLKLALNRGWLNCVRIDTNRKPVYAFFHASFQEYFAAIAIDDWHFFLNHVPKNPSQGTYRIFEPQWKQTILLWLGREEENLKQQKQWFIDALVNFKDGCGNWNKKDLDKGFYEYRAYFLASVGIAEFKDYSRADEIVAQIVKWGFGYFNTKKQKWIQFPYVIEEEARTTLQQTDRTKAIATLVELIRTSQSEETREQAVSILGEIGKDNATAITVLVELIRTSQSEETREQAIYILGEIGKDNATAITVLVELIRTSQSKETCKQAIYILGEIGKDNATAITVLEELIYTSQNEYTRLLAASSLGKIAKDNTNYISILEEIIHTSQDEYTRLLAASSLGEIAKDNLTAIAALVELIITFPDEYIPLEAASSLEKIAKYNPKAIIALEELLLTSQDQDIRWLVAESLGKIAKYNLPTVMVGLEEFIWTSQNELPNLLLASLEKRGKDNLTAITALKELVGTAQDETTCRQATYSLGKTLTEPEKMTAVVTALKKYFSNETYKNDFELFKDCYKLIWHCARTMTYPAFYQAWHQHNVATRAMQSLKKIFFTRII
ncbi:NACHT domain-containing protein [Nostoc sp. PA-18-2419]|uniref:NACHT domain-containing protein n=1 Tax=Nostoc sp. PA-18-2419 TaxID=2575443 RepID=UPI001107AA97|nr:HEAT repeat domain-containing protein [Nostoc sp. PA-18-2419]